MAKAVGRPVALDRKTLNGTMGNYARVLIKVELVGAKVEEIQVEQKKPGTDIIFWFKQRVMYEDDLSRCTLCKKLGHMANQCRDKRDERKPVAQNNGNFIADDHVHGNLAGVGIEGSTEKAASPSCVRSPRLVGEYFPPMVMENVNGDMNYLVEGNLNLGGPNSNTNQCREDLEPNMVDNPLGEGSEQGEDDATPRAGNHLEESFVAWNLRPRCKIDYHGGHAGRGTTRGGRGGRGEEGVVSEHIVKGLPPTQLVGGRAIVHHPEVAAIDNALRAEEAAVRKGKAIMEKEQTAKGMKKASGKNALRVLVKEKDPDILCIAEPMIKISFVHASSFRAERRSLWMNLMADSPQSPTPWAIMGDFNATLQSHEKRGPGNFSMGSAVEFGAMVDACAMAQVPSSGMKFTWSNNRCRGNVRAMLDRSFCNDEWISRFQDCAQTVLDRIASDHAPIMVTSAMSQRPTNAPFRFHKFWIDHTDFENVAKTSFPNIDRALEDAKKNLKQVQLDTEANGLDDHSFAREADAKTSLIKALDLHEKLWVEKAKIRWMEQGDRNSRFFHLSAKMRRIRNTIRYLKKQDGTIVEGREQLGDYIVQFYKDFHKASPTIDHVDLLDSIPMVLQQNDIFFLDSIPGDEEIKKVIWELDPDSTPGPDGFTGAFFRRCWNIVEREDKWWGQRSIMEEINLDNSSSLITSATVGDFIREGQWHLPEVNAPLLKQIFNQIKKIKIPSVQTEDWKNQVSIANFLLWWKRRATGLNVKKPWKMGFLLITYHLWWERNQRRHEAKARQAKFIFESIRQELILCHGGSCKEVKAVSDVLCCRNWV
ncbi:uncharacterized protein LOC122064425 [Macadamia integrifolia]|uniref:uncharacterized protein LOC122064425 n=1 Tax=Macadamia integrifolia TaxID=60698 RepID=UPI001C4FC336|nr:uncharacterized protein LOC122064425 [Macadamia integrifolia]